ncbi:Phosphatase YidA [Listeria grayi]|uniref:Cof-like hydrolase n=3 Tax=Listeria grayi TaxID=1641 RepID=D7UZN4_LISGR|nr:Cof-type HAD-IIB family hydrolase [Listeria grayi]EFI82879.1 Cof-like hydrolase [Listeria grayi DSM 20601]EUJ28870.1 HAD-superfamily hydrolase [Listeria grayi FSL F6-1183]MBC1921419.1 Cof-type HAD-IIB family hydrolase [Listeria grayi]STY44143.1 Phosphatase YidA [Listeria grayi]VEI35818.1 Phosphatase YidA [Listeria grayi]
MDKKLIVLDLDGTTLRDDQTISQTTKQTLQRARNAGHEVMIATGRPYRLSNLFYDELTLTTPIVNFNGAVYHHPKMPDFADRYHHSIDLNIVHELLDFTSHLPLRNIAAEVEDFVFIREENESVPASMHLGLENVKIGDIRQNVNIDPTSVLLFGQDEQLVLIRKYLDKQLSSKLSYTTWGAAWPAIEIIKHGINKAVGVKAAAKSLGFDRKDIIAFGDELNDLEMLEFAGTGVAMGNGNEQVKNIANTTTLSNEDDGIAIYLQENLGV